MIVVALTLALAAQASPVPPGAPPAAAPHTAAVMNTSAPLAEAPSSAPAAVTPPEERVFCRHVDPEGTMIGTRKECHTAKVWTQMAHAQ